MPNNFRDDLIAVLETVSKAQLHALRRLRGRPAEAPRGEARPENALNVCPMSIWYMTYCKASAAPSTSPQS